MLLVPVAHRECGPKKCNRTPHNAAIHRPHNECHIRALNPLGAQWLVRVIRAIHGVLASHGILAIHDGLRGERPLNRTILTALYNSFSL